MLRKNLGPIQIQLISLGGIIGSGYFLGVGPILKQNGASTLLAFLLGGLIVWLVSMAMSELCVGMKREGSFVSQSRELLGRPWAAGVGWSYWFNWCAYIPSEMLAGGMILHEFYPNTSVITWAALFAMIITAVNLLNVKYFGHVESGLSLLKISAMGVFTAIGGLIWLGVIGQEPTPALLTPFIGPLPQSALANVEPILPGGAFAFLITMVLVLVNFQGTELIALSAAESKNPEKDIPRATRNVALRIVLLYMLPITVLILIFPLQEATADHSAFAAALSRYGFSNWALVLQWVIITAALSCSNSGLYGAVRSLYGLGKEGLAPPWVSKVNAEGVPAYATWMTIGVCWAFLPLYYFFENSTFYTWLLSVSGFTGALCWISITFCQIQMRKKMKQEGVSVKTLAYWMPGFPYLSWLSLGLQLMCLVFLAFHPTLRSSLILGIPAFAVPAIFCWAKDRKQQSAEKVIKIGKKRTPSSGTPGRSGVGGNESGSEDYDDTMAARGAISNGETVIHP
ncbi:MAG: amino acid permease [Bdellovibrionia bacterium]